MIFVCVDDLLTVEFGGRFVEHVNDMVYSVEKLNALVSAARVDLEAFKARESHHRQSKWWCIFFFHGCCICRPSTNVCLRDLFPVHYLTSGGEESTKSHILGDCGVPVNCDGGGCANLAHPEFL